MSKAKMNGLLIYIICESGRERGGMEGGREIFNKQGNPTNTQTTRINTTRNNGKVTQQIGRKLCKLS